MNFENDAKTACKIHSRAIESSVQRKRFLKTAAIIPSLLLFLLALQTDVFPSSSLASNGKIVFESNRDGQAEVYVMNSDGTNPTRLTVNPASDFDASFSPDGQKIIFVSSRDGSLQIYVMNVDGSSQTRLSNDSSNNIDPVWSPDGTRIVFASDRNGSRYQIYAMNADGTNVMRLTNDSQNDTSPSWSPDGTKIAFDDARPAIYVMNPDGSNVTRISNSVDVQPSWSPDGAKIVFVSQRSGSAQIYSMNPDGTGQTNLTRNLSSNFTPAWSPDNKKIAFANNSSGYYRVFVMNSDGTKPTALTNNTHGDGAPRWQALSTAVCPHTFGFWKSNQSLWPATSMVLGNETYTQTQLIALLNQLPKGDASLKLAHQLIATKLNIANGSLSKPIRGKVVASDRLLRQFEGFLPYHVKSKSDLGSQMAILNTALKDYNTGGSTPACAP